MRTPPESRIEGSDQNYSCGCIWPLLPVVCRSCEGGLGGYPLWMGVEQATHSPLLNYDCATMVPEASHRIASMRFGWIGEEGAEDVGMTDFLEQNHPLHIVA